MNNSCLICGSKLKYNSNFTLKCKNCNFYISELTKGFGAPVEGIDDVRLNNFEKIFTILKDEIKEDSKILEIGPGKGLFMKLAVSKKIDITGIEPGIKESQNLTNQGYKIFNYEFPLKNFNIGDTYNFIIFNDVLEHIHISKLEEAIKQCHKLLKKNGFLIINLPNSNGIFFRISALLKIFKINIFYDRLWQKNFSSPHMVYFNSNNLNIFVQNYKFNFYKEFNLDTINKNSKKRISHSIKNIFLLNIISFFIDFLSYFVKFLPKDIILKIYKKRDAVD